MIPEKQHEVKTRPQSLTTTLPDQINAEHLACMQAAGKALEHAMRCGDLLMEAKAGCQHGDWQGWLAEHFEGSDRTARAYMQLADNRELLESKRQGPAVLGVEKALKMIAGPKSDAVHVSHNTGQPEWYTPLHILDAARKVLGEIELDPASSEVAQETVQARKYYTAEQDGLSQAWCGNVWLNPPYATGQVEKFTNKLIGHFSCGDIQEAILLVNNATDTKWFQEALKWCDGFCLIAGRLKFLDERGDPSGAPLQGQAILYYGNHVGAFSAAYLGLGVIGYCITAGATP